MRGSRQALLLHDAITSVTVRGLVEAEAASHHPPLFKVCCAALTGVTAHAVLSAAGLQDGLPWDGLSVLHIHKQPDKKIRCKGWRKLRGLKDTKDFVKKKKKGF